ncbi:Cache 3/Cache 2 fusion domain-containing protein [Alsobacter sp. SYSU BS001988]
MDKAVFVWALALAGALAGAPTHLQAQSAADVQAAMQLLKAKTAQLGTPTLKGEEEVEGRKTPILYFGTTRMNGDFALVDAVQKEKGGTATLFVKTGEDFVRIATNVKKPDGSRAVGTLLDPKGKAIAALRRGGKFAGEVDILGKPYLTAYESMQDARGDVIGIYYVGYLKQ